uniref:NADH-ubiquinone oxidoreductase chain 4L n=1 Tax=Armadillidium nasatum TaxID=96803 RepID=A0A343F038_9CRUS|nr:NADH dehydrogenase subunit 4L [Armadillidium nasatum]
MFSFMFLVAFLVFFLVFKHVLSSLISLEFLVLAMFMLLSLFPLSSSMEMYTSFFFISIVVCEAALGLSLVILWVRKKGNDLFTSF